MELSEKELLGARRYYALIRAAANAQNPEFKTLWKNKLRDLIKQNKEEVASYVKHR